jgi:hypothetical protein
MTRDIEIDQIAASYSDDERASFAGRIGQLAFFHRMVTQRFNDLGNSQIPGQIDVWHVSMGSRTKVAILTAAEARALSALLHVPK